MKVRGLLGWSLGSVLGLASVLAFAMEPLDDRALADTHGQDGLLVHWQAQAVRADQIVIEMGAGTDSAASLTLEQPSLQAIHRDGQPRGTPATLITQVDVGGTGQGRAALAVDMVMDRVRVGMEALRLSGLPQASFGRLALDLSGQLRLSNVGGLFNQQGGASLRAELHDGTLFYAQQEGAAPHLLLNHLNLLWDMPHGTLAIAPRAHATGHLAQPGLRLAADLVHVGLAADLLFKDPQAVGETGAFRITGGEQGLLHLGWSGSLRDAELILRGGGLVDESGQFRSDGINLSTRWNYHHDGLPGAIGARPFRWQLGQVAGGPGAWPMRLEFSDWVNLPGVTWGHDIPYLALALLGPGARPPGLCWGTASGGECTGQTLALPPGEVDAFGVRHRQAAALALMLQGAQLQSYARTLRVHDGSDPEQPFDAAAAFNRTLDWGLIYTMANLDANLWLYPGGGADQAGAGAQGLIADLLLMSQTAPRAAGQLWGPGTHLMIADTAAAEGRGMGIGLLDIRFLLAANDLRLWLKPLQSLQAPYSGGLDLASRETRLAFEGTFGGAVLDGTQVIQGIRLALNYEGLMNLRLSPAPTGQSYLGYSAAFRSRALTGPLSGGEGTWLALSEPGRPDVQIRLADIQGDLALEQGRVELISAGGENGDGHARLRISHDILVGTSAEGRLADAMQGDSLPGGTAGQPLRTRVEFAGEPLGQIVVPSGQWGASLSIRAQTPHGQ